MVFKHITHLMGYLSITDCLAYRYVTVETHSRSPSKTVPFQEDVQAERHFQRQDQSDSGFMGVMGAMEDDDTKKGGDRRTFGYSNTITTEHSKFCRVEVLT